MSAAFIIGSESDAGYFFTILLVDKVLRGSEISFLPLFTIIYHFAQFAGLFEHYRNRVCISTLFSLFF